MHPELFSIGGRTFYTYGVVFGISILLGVVLSARRGKKEGISETQMLTAMMMGIIGIIVMSKAMHVLVSWEWYSKDYSRLLNFRKGHVFYGGYIGAVLFPYVYTKIIKVRYLPMLDICATYMPLSLAFHRSLGCFNAGCCYGKPTGLPWGITFPDGASACKLYGHVAVHPTQFYEAGLALLMFGVLLYYREHFKKIPGELVTLQVALYAVGRFFIEFFRGDPRGSYGPLSTAQWTSILMLVVAGIVAVFLCRQRKRLGEQNEPAPTL